jgi:hypothetical protein
MMPGVHFHSIGILGVAARVERSNRKTAVAMGDNVAVAHLDGIIADYETAIEKLTTAETPVATTEEIRRAS